MTTPEQEWARAVYYRQRELNEIRDALAIPVTATHEQVITAIVELRSKENRDRTN